MRMTLGVLAVLLGGAAWAEDRALVVGNQNYSDAADVTAADSAQLAARNLRTAGFAVIEGADLTVADLRARLGQALLEGVEPGRLVILLLGHFAQSGSQTWFLGTDASAPDLVTVGTQGVTVATVLEVAATQAGGAVVLLGTEARRLPLGPGLVPGIGALEVPQGVTLITGDAGRIADFAARSLAGRGQSLPALLASAPDLTASGFLSRLVPFRPADPSAPPRHARGAGCGKHLLAKHPRTGHARGIRRLSEALSQGAFRRSGPDRSRPDQGRAGARGAVGRNGAGPDAR